MREWPEKSMESESYYTTDGDTAYIRVRSPHGPLRSEEQPWGLRDDDERIERQPA
jgi:hypothetical protein